MGEWVVGACINLFGSIAINFGTNLLKLGHDERERHAVLVEGINGKTLLRPIISFQSWRIGILFFAFGNALNFISFGYAAQSLLAALGSVQFVSNIAFAYFVLQKTVTVKVIIATTFIVFGNIFLVAFGNHQSPVYTQEQLAEKYSNITFLFYCLLLVVVVLMHHYVYRRGELLLTIPGKDLMRYWKLLLPFSFAVVSGAIGSCSVLFAKSLSNLLRLSMSSSYRLDSWFTYSILLLFLCTAGFWMARLNEGLSQFDAILIVPMFQIAWTFFSICTGFVYFQEYQVLNALRTTMFILGMISVFIGITLLAPDESKEAKESQLSSVASSYVNPETERLGKSAACEDTQIKDMKSFAKAMATKATAAVVKAKSTCTLVLGMGDDAMTMHASSVFAMPMVSSKMNGFRGVGGGGDRSKLSLRSPSGWGRIPVEEDESVNMLDSITTSTEED